MKTKGTILFFAGLATFLIGCTNDDAPDFSTVNINTITYETARLRCPVVVAEGATVDSCGVCWSLDENPTIADSTKKGIYVNNVVTGDIHGLVPNTMYYARAYVRSSAGLTYSKQATFSTKRYAAFADTLSCTDSSASILLKVNAEYNIYPYYKSLVLQWGSTRDLTGEPFVVTGMYPIQKTCVIMNLQHDTKYYYRAYSETTFGTYYSEIDSFKTDTLRVL